MVNFVLILITLSFILILHNLLLHLLLDDRLLRLLGMEVRLAEELLNTI